MGACCTARDKDRESDLPAPEIEGNAFEKFELSLPFKRTYADTFEKRVRAAAAANKERGQGDGTTVTVEALRETFKTPAWSEIKQDDSRLVKLLKSPVFQNKKGAINVDYLLIFGFLNCPGDVATKSDVLYNLF